jgi:hypothetical protein
MPARSPIGAKFDELIEMINHRSVRLSGCGRGSNWTYTGVIAPHGYIREIVIRFTGIDASAKLEMFNRFE